MGNNVNRNFSLIYQKLMDEAIKSKMKIKITIHFYVKRRNIKLARLMRVKVEYVVIFGGFFLGICSSLEKYYQIYLQLTWCLHLFSPYSHFNYSNLIASNLAQYLTAFAFKVRNLCELVLFKGDIVLLCHVKFQAFVYSGGLGALDAF